MPLPLDVTQQLIWTCGFVLPSSHDKHVLYATPGKGFTKDMYTWTSNQTYYIFVHTVHTHLWMTQYMYISKTCDMCYCNSFDWGNWFINMIYDGVFIPIVVPLIICYMYSTCINIFWSMQIVSFAKIEEGCCHFTNILYL